MHIWIGNDGVAERALLRLRPHLVVKADHVEFALEARRIGTRRRGSVGRWMPYATWERMIALENAIKNLNGRSYQKIEATADNRAYGFLT